ncbi:MAG: hypothetical protein JWN49_588 [Parcubacteria group bacterium]|nr:hypothetical protein [Parcubacteria group bacterium]
MLCVAGETQSIQNVYHSYLFLLRNYGINPELVNNLISIPSGTVQKCRCARIYRTGWKLERAKPALRRVLRGSDRYDKPSSVGVQPYGCTPDDHLSRPTITSRLERRSACFRRSFGTALHRDKDLAVSVWRRRQPTLKESIYPFGVDRLCSHLAHCCGRALPATFLRLTTPVLGLSSRPYGRAIVCIGPGSIIPLLEDFARTGNTCQFLLELCLVNALVEHELCVVHDREALHTVFVLLLGDSFVRCKTVDVVITWKE